MNIFEFWSQGDALSKSVAILLLAMSVLSWVLILWKSFAHMGDLAQSRNSLAAFWQAPSLEDGRNALALHDRKQLLIPVLEAGLSLQQTSRTQNLAGQGELAQQLTRVLRNSLQDQVQRLQFGQIALATIGSTAPFVGLLGTVWGIYHALLGIGAGGQISIDKIATPVGEALIMTAFGLIVAIPAVLGYNLFGRKIAHIEQLLEGFARDLRELLTSGGIAAKRG